MRAALLGSLLAGLLALPAGAVAAPPDRAAAVAAFDSVRENARVPAGWTGSTESCTVGTESAESLGATLETVNTLRDFAGVAPVSFDDGLNRRALAAALMMRAEGDLSHDPPPSWKCYSEEGRDGAGHSNLALGTSGSDAMLAYADDSGVDGLGHRRWLLDPSRQVFGSGSTGSTNALYVLGGSSAAVAADTVVAWPAAGWFPRSWVPGEWSVSVGGSGQDVRFEDPSVTVTLGGQPLPVSDVKDLDSGFGSGRALSWRPSLDALPASDGDHELAVSVSGAVVDGRPLPIAYTVRSFAGAAAPPRFVTRPTLRRRGSRLAVRARVTGGKVSRYTWLRDGRRVRGAKGKTLRLRSRDRGHVFAVRVTAKSPAGVTAKRTTKRLRIRR